METIFNPVDFIYFADGDLLDDEYSYRDYDQDVYEFDEDNEPDVEYPQITIYDREVDE